MSVLFDRGARAHLALAYANRGAWTGRPLAAPTMEHRIWALQLGINLDSSDPAKLAVGTVINRWDAGFERAVYYQHRWFWDGRTGFAAERRMTPTRDAAVQVQFSDRARRFQVGPRSFYGRAVRIRVLAGGSRAVAAVRKLPGDDQIHSAAGLGGKWGSPQDRDWA